jgi:hypothetical protein
MRQQQQQEKEEHMGTFKIKNFFSNGILPSLPSKPLASSKESADNRKPVAAQDQISLSSEALNKPEKENQASQLSAGLADSYGSARVPQNSSNQIQKKKPNTRDEIIRDFRRKQIEHSRKVNQRILEIITK